MRHILIISFISLALIYVSCKQNTKATDNQTMNDNPLMQPFDTPYGVPAFDKIKNEHYMPAFEAAMKKHIEEVDAISNNSEAPSMENTIEAMDRIGSDLNRVSSVFFNMSGAHTNDTIKELEKELAPILSNHSDYISLNEKLFERVKAVYDSKGSLKLDEDQAKLLEDTYKTFVRNGALLKGDARERIKEINAEMASTTVKFGQNVLADVNDFKYFVDNKEDLKGLPENIIANAAVEAKNAGQDGKWLFTLQNPSIMPLLQFAENRDLRYKMWDAYRNRGNNNNANNNKENIKKLTNLRLERAKLLGYPTHAHFVLEERMAKTPQNVNKLLMQLWKPTMETSKKELSEINDLIKNEGGNFTAGAHDWRYYAEKIRVAKYALDENEVKQYFAFDNVTNGVFATVQKLWGLTFTPRKDLPTYHPEATPYEVKDANGEFIGILYIDLHPRESKRGGAWMTSFSDQKMKDGKRVPPVISIVCNFTKGTEEEPALFTIDEVSTYFHEFGHALHGLLSNTRYTTQAGTNVPTDFVELPSMIMENWPTEPEVLKLFAKHYKTGEIIPATLLKKIEDAGKYGQGFATAEYLASALLDLGYHLNTETWEKDPVEFEKSYMSSLGLIEEIIPRHRSTHFNHIFAGGYSAGYYSYVWSEVLDSDAYEVFKQKGIFDNATAQSFRENILEKGGSADPMELYKRFRGAAPSTDALLKRKGFKS